MIGDSGSGGSGDGRVGATEAIAGFVGSTRLTDIGPAVQDSAKRVLLDTLGVIVAGLSSDVATTLLKFAADQPRGDTLVVGTSTSASRQVAALLNAALGHAHDYDDVVSLLPGHPSSVVVGALVASCSDDTAPAAVLEAYIVGIEVGAKLGKALGREHYDRGWHATSTLGVFAAVAALGRLHSLDELAIRHSLGIAASTAAGLRRNFGTMTKPLHSGIAAHNAVMATSLAELGFTAGDDVIECPGGFFDLYGGPASAAGDVAGQLGTPFVFEDAGVTVKRYPSCHGTHRGVDALLSLRGEHALPSDQVREIACRIRPGGLKSLRYRTPVTGLEGKFSLNYCLAAAMVDGFLSLDTFTDVAVRRRELADLVERTEVTEDAAVVAADGTGVVSVSISMDDGTVLERSVADTRSARQRELGWDEVEEKFVRCVGTAGVPYERAREAATMVRELEQVASIGEIVALLR